MSSWAEITSLLVPGLAAVLAWLMIHSPIEPASWALSPLQPMPHDNRLSSAQRFFEGSFPGAEHIHVDCTRKQCTAYSGLADGNIVRWNPDDLEIGFEVLARTGCIDGCPSDEVARKCGSLAYEHVCGRPLGMHLTTNKKVLLIGDSYKGLLALSLADNKLTRVASTYSDMEGNTVPLHFVNSVAVSRRGRVYFTQTAKKFERREVMIEMMEGQAGGSLLTMDSWDQKKLPKLIAGNLTFANGVVVDDRDSFALVAETSRCRIKRVDLKTHAVTTFIEDLQGVPDNLAWGVGKDGVQPDYSTLWVGVAVKRSMPFAFANFLGDKTTMRQIFATILYHTRTSHLFYPLFPRTGVVMRLKVEAGGNAGSVQDVLLDRSGATVTHVTSATPHKDSILMGSHLASVNWLTVYKMG